MNNVSLIGNLTKNIELKKTNAGKSIAKFTLAVRRKAEETDFIQCIAWEKTAELLNTYCAKGSKIAVVGRIQTGSYDNQSGQKVYTTDIIVEQVEFLSKAEKAEEPIKVQSDDLPF